MSRTREADATTFIPGLPNKAATVVIRHRSFRLDRHQWHDEAFSRWYRFTWGRFTTVVPVGDKGWRWRFQRAPIACDLGRWLTDAKAQLSRQTEASAVVGPDHLPAQG
jgi:hypothetical protein